jgi:tetratricopeptide (TPR) repeat protein
VELTPEERQRIFEEEKIRAEARTEIEKTRKEQLLEVRRASRGRFSTKKTIVWVGLPLALLTVLVWNIKVRFANEELVAALQLAEKSIGASPSDDSWKASHYHAMLAGARDSDPRTTALLYIQSLEYAVNDDRVASSYRSLGLELEKVKLIEAAERCYRSAAALEPHDDFTQECLANLLMGEKEYAEAETIYREILPRASTANDKFGLNFRLAEPLEATGRKTEADNYKKEYEKWIREVK